MDFMVYFVKDSSDREEPTDGWMTTARSGTDGRTGAAYLGGPPHGTGRWPGVTRRQGGPRRGACYWPESSPSPPAGVGSGSPFHQDCPLQT